MRLIDADALKRKVQKEATESWKMKIKASVETILNQVIYWIDEAQTVLPEQQWIPVTKRLPKEEKKQYWVCTDTGNQRECRWTNNRFGMGEFDEWGWSIFDMPRYSHVVAWMPLPEPYKGGAE